MKQRYSQASVVAMAVAAAIELAGQRRQSESDRYGYRERPYLFSSAV